VCCCADDSARDKGKRKEEGKYPRASFRPSAVTFYLSSSL
jgi:hypothetical protein